MKYIQWIGDHILFVFTLFLLAFIPLYPKLPILDVVNTWVYVRAEDFVVVLVLLVWTFLFLSRKITLKTPLTMPILFFWVTGAIATIHGVLLIFPGLANVFPNVAFLSFLRRIEYISLFFVAYSAMKDKRFLFLVVVVLSLTLLFVSLYGFGQKYFEFPAYLTMNEEFAKGEAIRLSQLSRVPSTFGGHYDLAAYLVLVIPILTSIVFGIRNWFGRFFLLATIALGFILLFMTVSRVSFFVLLISLFTVLLFQKKRIFIFFLPIVAILLFLFVSLAPTLLERYGNTVKEVDVLVDARNGEAIGNPTIVPAEYFKDKIVIQEVTQNKEVQTLATPSAKLATPSARLASPSATIASPSAIIPYTLLPSQVILLVATNTSTGESLPQGTGYINLSLSPVTKRVGEYFYQKPMREGSETAEVLIVHGDFLVKRASAYDLSFTTRFQGEWPRAIEAFKRNILFGSGYSAISLAVDNNYLRLLGEVGLLGFASFVAIFVALGIYIRKLLPKVDSPFVRSFVIGFASGTLGLALNAIFIDVFEASKVAFLLWLLTGITIGILNLYQTEKIHLYQEFKRAVTSSYAIIVYISVIVVLVFSPMISNYFVGDDFTWFRWAADCNKRSECIAGYFTETDGFFYRPGTKMYFALMYTLFWLNQTVYHMVSIFLHFIVAVLVFLLAKKIFRNTLLSMLSAFLFLLLSGYSESVFWTAATGHLLNALFIFASLLFFTLWEEKKHVFYYVVSLFSLIFSLLFHELGVITPLLLMLYKFITDETFTWRHTFKKIHCVLLFVPLIPYLALRFLAGSHWTGGDYSYNLLKLPFNIAGNLIGYLMLTLFGPTSLPFIQALRNFSKEHIVFAGVIFLAVTGASIFAYRMITSRMDKGDRKVVFFGILFFVIALLPFLGLGNISSRYSYVASFGVILLIIFFVNKLYRYLLNNGRDIALASVCVVFALFSLLHVIQLQQIHSDWYSAGERVRRFFIAIDGLYSDYWSAEPVEFHFVNVPTRQGEAWVFPVGLSDALWFAFRNPNMFVYRSESATQALSEVSGSANEKVFEFDTSGGLIERKKMPDVP